jgi:predicted transcriptional regulator
MSQEDAALRELVEKIRKTGMPFVEIAEYLGVHERTLFRWLAGDSYAPRMAYIALKLLAEGK